ncbi:hypothetical protein GCM10007298_36190 [Williamsia phyllosphaerae]|uniref:Diguanylate cyclase n=1 Tax=Williamsia phyllosphaerae TaxID=885042 RepID=A0ABQ1V4G0_9NOCA|nr:hypothetical protein GCM10007298_36190 [Williamsia phyllosphaerae]
MAVTIERRPEQTEVLRRVIDTVPALIGYWDTDLRNVASNLAYVDYFGLTPDQVRGMHIRDVLGPSVYELNKPFIDGALRGEHQQFDRTLIDAGGKIRFTQATYIPDVVDGVVRGFVVHVSDVSERVQAEKARDDAVTLFETAMSNAPIGQAVVDTSGRWLQVNQAMCDLTGYSADELRDLSFRDITHPDDVPAADLHLAQLLEGSRTHIESEKRYIRKDGSIVWVQRNAVIVHGVGAGAADIVIAQIQDITQRKNAEAELARQAVTDALTGLGNRHSLMAQIDALRHLRADGVGLLFLDLDGFKSVNDTYGHSAGDELLADVASRIRRTIDDGDLACRIGGDEFVVIIYSATSPEDIERHRVALKRAVAGDYLLPSLTEPITIGASVGSSWSNTGDHRDHRDLLTVADQDMYRDKIATRHAIVATQPITPPDDH